MFTIFERFLKFLLHDGFESDWEADQLEAVESSTTFTFPKPIQEQIVPPPVTPKTNLKQTSPRKVSQPANGLSPKQKQRILKAKCARLHAQAAADSERSHKIRRGKARAENSATRSRKPDGSRNAYPIPFSLNPTIAKNSLLSEHDGSVSSMSIVEEETATSPPDARCRTLRPIDLQYAYKWFHVTRKMVMGEGRRDYRLAYACQPYSLVFMVYHGWANLNDVLAWKHGRHLLGQGLVELSTLRNGIENLHAAGQVDKPTESAVADFLRGWPRSTDPTKNYKWKADAKDRKEHGPFGPALARYATPEVQEKALKALLKSDVPLDRVDLPGNWKPLFLPLFLRKRVSEEVRDDKTPQESPADEGKERYTYQTTVNDVMEESSSEVRRDKGKGRAIPEVWRDDGETRFPRAWGCEDATRSFEMRIDEEGSGTFGSRVDGGGAGYFKRQMDEGDARSSGMQVDGWECNSDDVRMDEVNAEPSGVWTGDVEADMSTEYTGPPQFTSESAALFVMGSTGNASDGGGTGKRGRGTGRRGTGGRRSGGRGTGGHRGNGR